MIAAAADLWRRAVLCWHRLTLLSNLRWVCEHIDDLIEQGDSHPSNSETLVQMQRVRAQLMDQINDINRALAK